MKTADLENALKLCKSSLLSMDIVPVLSHFCFVDDYVYAYNDVSAVMVPLQTGINAALKGDTLLGIIPTLAGEVTLEPNENNTKVHLKSGRVKIDLAALPPKSFVFEPPDEDVSLKLTLSDEVASGLQACLNTVGISALLREYTGICIEYNQKKKTVIIYSTDDTRLSVLTLKEDFKVSSKERTSWLLPASPLKQILDMRESHKQDIELSFGETWMWANVKDILFFSKLMPETPPNYADIVESIAPPEAAWFKKPEGLHNSFLRAQVLTYKELRPAIELRTSGTEVRIIVGKENARGAFDEPFRLKTEVPEVTLALDPDKLAEVAETVDSVAAHDRCLAMKKGNYLCYIAPLRN